MRGGIQKKGNKYYAVVYDGIDPGTGRKRRRWVPAGSRRGDAERLLAADHRRLLGNGHCTRPVALDCNFETICERCGFFETGPQFVEIIQRQRDHAASNDQPDRAQLFTQLLDDIDNTT